MMRVRRFVLSLALAVGAWVAGTGAYAVPKQIIILRHAEKYSPFELCKMGVQRSLALVSQYLGRGAADSLFSGGAGPAAFFAVNTQGLQTASYAATTWGLPVIDYTIPPPFKTDEEENDALNLRTRQAVDDLLTNPAWDDKVVVLVWEYRHIAHKDLNKQVPAVTLRALLGLDKLTGANLAPESWEANNYDYFWIVDFNGSPAPVGFTARKQIFIGKYKDVPANAWARPEKPKPIGCE